MENLEPPPNPPMTRLEKLSHYWWSLDLWLRHWEPTSWFGKLLRVVAAYLLLWAAAWLLLAVLDLLGLRYYFLDSGPAFDRWQPERSEDW